MKIECKDCTVQEALTDRFYSIPRFQRPYSWDRDNVKEFLDDTFLERDSDVFIGSIVVSHEQKDLFNIVDGQQRLTTITLILATLRDRMHAAGLHDLASGSHQLILRKDINAKQRPVLGTQSGYPFLQDRLQPHIGESNDQYRPSPDEKLIFSAYLCINEWLDDHLIRSAGKKQSKLLDKDWMEEQLSWLRDKLLGLKLIRIVLENEDDAYLIFETLNTRGLDLSVSDMIKSYVLRTLPAKSTNADVPKDQWDELCAGLLKQPYGVSPSTFLLHFWLSKHEYVGEKKLFRSVKATIKTRNEVKSFLEELIDEAENYKTILDADDRVWRPEEFPVRDSLLALQLFRLKQQIPMVMAALRMYSKRVVTLKQLRLCLSAIEAFHFQFTAIASERSSGGISQMYSLSARELSKAVDSQEAAAAIDVLIKKLRQRVPSREVFIAEFKSLRYSSADSSRRMIVRYALEKIETTLLPPDAPTDYSRMSVEHIAPQTELKVLGPKVHSIGNLMLLDPSSNSSLGNKAFLEKKKKMLMLPKTYVDECIRNATSWGQDEIDRRAKWLAEVSFDRVWKF
jgi:hypothetical protein